MYNGNEPYIFISYAHKNSDVVVPIIEALANNGFRVWYDAGIEAGTEWPEYVAEKLLGSSVVIAFISKAALESQNCRREINYSISHNKDVLSVYIEDVTLTPGMEMQLSTTQAMFYDRAPYETFLQQLMGAAILTPCTDNRASSSGAAAQAQKAAPTFSPDFEVENGVLKKYLGDAETVVIPQGITVIGNGAFCECYRLKRVVIPDGVTSIGEPLVLSDFLSLSVKGAFRDCVNLTSVTIPDSVTIIGPDAFSYCSDLTDVTLPAGLTIIDDHAFYRCSSLESITVPSKVMRIGRSAFAGCARLSSLTVDKDNFVYEGKGNCIIESLTGTLTVGCKNSVIPDKVTAIGVSAFCACSGLEAITIPDGVTTIGTEAFGHCSSLTSVVIPDSVTKIDMMAFQGCTKLAAVTIPNSVTSVEALAFDDCPNLKIYRKPFASQKGWASNWNPGNRPIAWGLKK